MSPLFVGLDLGTSGGRCAIVDEAGVLAASAARPWTYTTEGLGMAELEPAAAWTAMTEATREAVSRVGAGEVEAIGVTSQRTGVVLLDAEGNELYSGPNADGRGVAEGLRLEKEFGEEIYRTTGRLPAMLYLPARLGWFRANRPEVLERTRWALAYSDWLVHRLTGVAATEPTQAAEMLVYDLKAGAWSDDLCTRLAVPPHVLPPILDAGAAAGELTAAAAEALGLPASIPVVPAGCDTQCAALAQGVTEPGRAIVVAGTTMLAEQVSAEPEIDDRRRLWTSPHPAGGFVLEAHCGDAGAALSWVTSVLDVDHPSLDAMAAKGQPGGGGMVFVGPVASEVGDFPMLRTGALTFPAPLLALARPREDVARACVEGAAFAAAAGLEWTQDALGPAGSVAVAGGVARSETFVRLVASALGREVRTATRRQASGRGAAMLAAVGTGLHPGAAAAARAMADAGRVVEPVPEWGGSAYATWRETASRLDANAMRVRNMMG
ncbi:MAG: FGGY-family carbohydrate kinase [Actinomycetota bacterium]